MSEQQSQPNRLYTRIKVYIVNIQVRMSKQIAPQNRVESRGGAPETPRLPAASPSKQRPRLNSVAYSVIILTAITAFIHLYLSFQFPEGPDPAFLLNGIGYLVLVTAIYGPIPALARYRSWLSWLLIAYTALTITLWIFFGATTWIAYADKAVEIALLLLTWVEVRRFAEAK